MGGPLGATLGAEWVGSLGHRGLEGTQQPAQGLGQGSVPTVSWKQRPWGWFGPVPGDGVAFPWLLERSQFFFQLNRPLGSLVLQSVLLSVTLQGVCRPPLMLIRDFILGLECPEA